MQDQSASDKPATMPAQGDHDQHTPAEVASQAATWVVLRHGAAWSRDDQARLDDWLLAHISHRDAYVRAQQAWTMMGELESDPALLASIQPAAGQPAAPDPDVPATAEVPAPQAANPLAEACRFPRRRAFVRGMAAALIGAAALGMLAQWQGFDPVLAWQADYRTGPGEIREYVLADGSIMQLGPNSAASLAYSANERRIHLLRGLALFDAISVGQSGETRPFTVLAEGGMTRALGTRFTVETWDGDTRVIGLENLVRVTLEARPGLNPVVLSPGETVSYSPERMGRPGPVDIIHATAWRSGLIVFDREEAASAIARLAHYHGERILIPGDALAQRRISGIFSLNAKDEALAAIARELNARVIRLPFVTLLRDQSDA